MANASPSCSFSTSWSMGCKSVAGIVEVYVGAFSSTTTSFTYVPTGSTAGLITGGTNAPVFYTLEQGLEYADIMFEGGHSVENGTNFWNHTANLKFNPYDAINRNLLTALANPRLMLIAYTQSGIYVILGSTNGLDVTASSGGFAKELGGMNGSLITLTGKEPSAPREISAAYFATLSIN